MKQIRKKYDRIFKEKVVRISYEKSSLKAYANEIGINTSLLTRWRQQHQKFGTASFPGAGHSRANPDEKFIFKLEKEAQKSELRFRILKDGYQHLYKEKAVIYSFIFENEHKYTIQEMCNVLDVLRGGYFKWKRNGLSEKHKSLILLKKDITSIFYKFKKHYGRRKMTRELKKQGYEISESKVTLYMRKLGLKSTPKRKFKITTDSKHLHYTAPNILDRQFRPSTYSKAWVSDITYLQTNKGFLYLTIIMDLYDRKIIGWSLSTRLLTVQTTLAAWEMAVANRPFPEGLLFHSDRGVQYANKAFSKVLTDYHCIQSMSRKGNSLDNAVAESFFNSLKREILTPQGKLPSQELMREEVFEFIEIWYNKNRIHSTLKYKTIEQFNSIQNSQV